MNKFCPKCGTPLASEAKFCPKCGNQLSIASQNVISQSFEQQASNVNQNQNVPPPPQNRNMQGYPNKQPQMPSQMQRQQAPMPPPPGRPYQTQQMWPNSYQKKSSFKIIVAIVAIVLIIAILLSLYFFVFSNDEGKFVGTWQTTRTTVRFTGDDLEQLGLEDKDITREDDDDGEFNFKSDGTWEDDGGNTGTWSLKDGKIVVNYDETSFFSGMMSFLQNIRYDYEFSGNSLKLSYTGSLADLMGSYYEEIPDIYIPDMSIYEGITVTVNVYLTKK